MTDVHPGLARLAEMLATLGIRPASPFRSPEIVAEALTHRSFASEKGGKHNERLEMLGDAVLGYLVADMLFELFPNAAEGVLTRLRASLVEEEALARQARTLSIGDLLSLGKGEERTGGRDRDSVLADAFEAVLAALYRSEGIELVTKLVDMLFRSEASQRGESTPQPTDFKTALQERTQAEWKTQPRYVIVDSSGPDHARLFVAEVHLGKTVAGRGEGRSKKVAEQSAAKATLDRWPELVQSIKASELVADRSPVE